MVVLDLMVDTVSGSSAYWLASISAGKMCFRWSRRHDVLVRLHLIVMWLVRRKMLATTRLLLCHSRMPQVSCSVIEDIGNLFRASIMSRLSGDPKCFFHELIQSLDSVIELARGLSEVLHVEFGGIGRSISPAVVVLQVGRGKHISHIWLWSFLPGRNCRM